MRCDAWTIVTWHHRDGYRYRDRYRDRYCDRYRYRYTYRDRDRYRERYSHRDRYRNRDFNGNRVTETVTKNVYTLPPLIRTRLIRTNRTLQDFLRLMALHNVFSCILFSEISPDRSGQIF